MAWPKYQPYARHAITGEHVKRFLADRQSLIAIGATVVIVFIYLLGLQFSLPIAHKDVIQKTIAQSTLLAAVNDLFTGGALGNASPFALGVLPLFFFYGGVVTLIGSRLRIQVQITRRAVSFVTLITPRSIW
jgi:hypothetical protein